MADRLSDFMKRAGTLALLILALRPAWALDIATQPLFLPSTVSPNIVVTLDDSGSMRWAFVPDLCPGNWDPDSMTCEVLHTKRFKSAFFNPLYYNPDIEYKAPLTANGTPLSTDFEQAYDNGFATDQGHVNLATSYRPTASYNPNPVTEYNFWTGKPVSRHFYAKHPEGDPDAGVAAYYYKFDHSLTNCDGTAADDDCYRKIVVGSNDDHAVGGSSEARKRNFANWYSFYRTRNLMTISAASLAFENVPKDFRVAWQSLNSCNNFNGITCANWAGTNYRNTIDRFENTHRQNFYAWMQKLPASGGTPLRSAMKRAGQYFTRSGANSPYDNNLASSSDDSEYTCRPNYHVLMTDGMWNGDSDDASIGNYDSTAQTLGDGSNYTARAPYKDSNSSSLADIAMYYWATDLRTDLTNNLAPYLPYKSSDLAVQKWDARNDPATWQHMVNFTVGLGLGVALAESGLTWIDEDSSGANIPPTYLGSYAGLKAGTVNWPAAGVNASGQEGLPGNVADLWHAAINSRGQFFSAMNPTSLTNAFKSILGGIESNSIRASAASQNSSRLSTDTIIYQASFDSGDWSGNLTAYKLNPTTGAIESMAWEAHSKLPAHDNRNIYTWNPSVGGVAFQYDNLTTQQQGALGGLTTLVDYLRGSSAMETTWRARGKKLGDIINSDPLFVGAEDFGYDSLPGIDSGAASYPAFLENTKKTRKSMIYVGANDGMLHAFGAGQTDGVEVFAFVPNAAILAQDSGGAYRLAQLKNPDYSHRFFVDGSPFAGDAYLALGTETTPSWRTVLVSGLGAGGKAVFALDVTQPASFNADKVMWEFSHADLGYTFGQPIIVRLNDGRWAAVFGNGYPDEAASATATAKLFIVYLDANAKDGWLEGTDYRVISTNAQTANGLSTPVAYDANQDRITDVLYAGDLQGNVWKFDLSSTDPADWGVAYKAGTDNKPLFRATNDSGLAQPITAAMELGRGPGGLPGVMVFFGTGRFVDKDDNKVPNDAPVQSFYGIYDNGTAIGNVNDRVDILQRQTITTLTNQAFGNVSFDVRFTSDDHVNYAGSKRGWFMDLPVTGERVVSQPLLRHGRVIFVTLIPSDDPCMQGGDSWLMEVNADNGDQPDQAVFDFDLDQTFDYVTYQGIPRPVSGFKSPVGIIDIPAVVTKDTSEIKIAFGTRSDASGSTSFRIGEAGGNRPSGRVSWREIIE